NSIPTDPDTGEIRSDATMALIRAAERAERTGSPARAATSYTTAAQLTEADPTQQQPAAAGLWERGARAAVTNGDFARAVQHAGRAQDLYTQHGDSRAAARAQATAGQAMRRWGRHTQAREQLTAAVEVLRENPDTDTVGALEELAALEVFAGSPEADRASSEALILGQALGVGAGQLSDLFLTRGIYLTTAERRPEAGAHFREAARLARQARG